uniref:Uncharacterized protein n=1 Tax=viral metagenome TaxID=1070528 RepID=A0A6C0D6J8_9ZZZZ
MLELSMPRALPCDNNCCIRCSRSEVEGPFCIDSIDLAKSATVFFK